MATASSGPRGLVRSSLARAFARHALILAVAVGGTFLLARAVSAQEQPLIWLLAGIAAGLLTSIVGRGPTGFASLAAGYAIGLLVQLQWRPGDGPAAGDLAALPIHLAALVVAAIAYTIGRLGARRWR